MKEIIWKTARGTLQAEGLRAILSWGNLLIHKLRDFRWRRNVCLCSSFPGQSYSSAERLQSVVSILSRFLCPALLLDRSLKLKMSLFSGSAIHIYHFRNLIFYITLLNKTGKNFIYTCDDYSFQSFKGRKQDILAPFWKFKNFTYAFPILGLDSQCDLIFNAPSPKKLVTHHKKFIMLLR